MKSFEDISNAATGNKKIAVYKADVDNLGMIFSIGLKKKKNVSDEELELYKKIKLIITVIK